MNCWAIVPVKRLAAAKSRLAPVLTLHQRRELVCALLAHSLIQLKGIKELRGKIVVGRDRAVQRIAVQHGAVFVPEKARDGLNRALARAVKAVVRRGADAVLIIPADLPLMKKADIVSALKRIGKPPLLRIAPDRTGSGTNLLLVAPPGLIRFAFGDWSFRRHVAAARCAGAKIIKLDRPSLAQDLDCPEDLLKLNRVLKKESTKRTKRNRKNTKQY